MNESQLRDMVGRLNPPPGDIVAQSRKRVQAWFAQTAPLIRWDVIASPFGPIYLAASGGGLCRLEFGVEQDEFLVSLDPLAHIERDPDKLAPAVEQIHEYFAGVRSHFDLPLDMERLRPFHRRVLEMARTIPYGTTRTYGELARDLGRPGAGRAVGHALSRNPLLIVVPCHRVVASGGALRGYRAGGLSIKRLLLELEGAL